MPDSARSRVPDEPVARLWYAANMLREQRGDGHIAALVTERIGGPEAHVLCALDQEIYPAESFGRIHHLPKTRLAAVMDGLRHRGLLGRAAASSGPGGTTKDRIESVTDALAQTPYDALEAGELDEPIALLEPVSGRLQATGSQ